MKHLFKYFFILLCLIPKLGMAMDLVIGDMQDHHRVENQQLIIIDEKEKFKEGEAIIAFQKIAFEVWQNIFKDLDVKEKARFFTRISKACSQIRSEKMHLVICELNLNLLFGPNKLTLKDNDATTIEAQNALDFKFDTNFERLLYCTKEIQNVAKESNDQPIKDQANQILNNIQDVAKPFLNDYRDVKGEFKLAKTIKLEKNYIYLSDIYNNEYEANNCCVPCGIYSKEYTIKPVVKCCVKPTINCFKGIGDGCVTCGKACCTKEGWMCCAVCTIPCWCPPVTALAAAGGVLFIACAIPCCCYIPCWIGLEVLTDDD